MSDGLEIRLRPEPGEVRALRHAVRAFLEPRGVAERKVDTLVLVLDEIVNNSIEHGRPYRAPGDEFVVRVRVEAGRVEIEFRDPSVPRDVVTEIVELLERVGRTAPPPTFERGRGLFLIRDGLDAIAIESDAGGVGMQMRGHIAR
ncbi:MAG: ATP-binding protein [Planctomycetes bacterium]|nr:ATP-binding protein [Planctomycetota bacterium]